MFNTPSGSMKSYVLVAALLAVSACGKSYDTEVRGEMTMTPMLGADSLMVEYEPSKFAVIYADSETKLVNIERTGGGVVWKLGGEVVVRGDRTESVEDFAGEDGVVYMTNSNKGDQVIDLWIDASYIEYVK